MAAEAEQGLGVVQKTDSHPQNCRAQGSGEAGETPGRGSLSSTPQCFALRGVALMGVFLPITKRLCLGWRHQPTGQGVGVGDWWKRQGCLWPPVTLAP